MSIQPHVEIHFDPKDLEPDALPAEILAELTDVQKDFRRVVCDDEVIVGQNYTIIGQHINGCGDEPGGEDYYVIPEDPYHPPIWLPEKCRTVLTGQVESNMTVSIKLVPADEGYVLTVESIGNYEAATGLFEEISMGCWAY